MRTIYVSPDFPLNRRMRKDIRRGKLQVVREGGERLSLGGGIPSGKGRAFRTFSSPLVCMADNGAEVGGGLGGGESGEGEMPPQNQIDAERLLSGLLQGNYFPRTGLHYIPPVFTTESFLPDVAKSIADALPTKRKDGTSGFDCVGYNHTRFDLIPRVFSIPHPAGHAPLCLFMRDQWDENISHICDSEQSATAPLDHEDGRIFDLSYDDEPEYAEGNDDQNPYVVVKPRGHQDGRIVDLYYKNHRKENRWVFDRSFGMRYLAVADISSFFPSVYTHAVCWAAAHDDNHTIAECVQEAKKQKHDKKLWFNRWDKLQRAVTRGETGGIPIGPGTSNIFSEFILQKIDREMRKMSQAAIWWRRAIDDYHAYAEKREDAEKFLLRLNAALGEFNLRLNPKKTKILELPDHSGDSWMFAVEAMAAAVNWDKISQMSLKKFLDSAALLATKHPDKSVLKYATTLAIRKIEDIGDDKRQKSACRAAVSCLANFSYHYPALISKLEKPFQWIKSWGDDEGDEVWEAHREKIMVVLEKGLDQRWSDVVSWALYYFILFGDAPEDKAAKAVVASKDCLPMALLFMMPRHWEKVRAAAQHLIRENEGDNLNCYDLDKQWLLLYQMFQEGVIGNPYPESDPAAKCFEIMRARGVNFLKMKDGYIHPSKKASDEDLPF